MYNDHFFYLIDFPVYILNWLSYFSHLTASSLKTLMIFRSILLKPLCCITTISVLPSATQGSVTRTVTGFTQPYGSYDLWLLFVIGSQEHLSLKLHTFLRWWPLQPLKWEWLLICHNRGVTHQNVQVDLSLTDVGLSALYLSPWPLTDPWDEMVACLPCCTTTWMELCVICFLGYVILLFQCFLQADLFFTLWFPMLLYSLKQSLLFVS